MKNGCVGHRGKGKAIRKSAENLKRIDHALRELRTVSSWTTQPFCQNYIVNSDAGRFGREICDYQSVASIRLSCDHRRFRTIRPSGGAAVGVHGRRRTSSWRAASAELPGWLQCWIAMPAQPSCEEDGRQPQSAGYLFFS